jgi:membrane protein DedA with SNARE-associated domain
MLFAGFDVFQGNLTLPGIIAAGTIGDMAGASIAYFIGYRGRGEVLERQGNPRHMSRRRLDAAHRWFDRYGAPAILVSRFIPVVRAAFPYAAGVAEMPFWRFLTVAALGSLIWITGIAVLGREVGNDWETWRHHLEYVDYVGVTLVVLAIAYVIVRRTRSGSREPSADHVSD